MILGVVEYPVFVEIDGVKVEVGVIEVNLDEIIKVEVA